MTTQLVRPPLFRVESWVCQLVLGLPAVVEGSWGSQLAIQLRRADTVAPSCAAAGRQPHARWGATLSLSVAAHALSFPTRCCCLLASPPLPIVPAQVPIIEGAGGKVTDWRGQPLRWPAGSQVRGGIRWREGTEAWVACLPASTRPLLLLLAAVRARRCGLQHALSALCVLCACCRAM